MYTHTHTFCSLLSCGYPIWESKSRKNPAAYFPYGCINILSCLHCLHRNTQTHRGTHIMCVPHYVCATLCVAYGAYVSCYYITTTYTRYTVWMLKDGCVSDSHLRLEGSLLWCDCTSLKSVTAAWCTVYRAVLPMQGESFLDDDVKISNYTLTPD